jgi:hypothetical protein
LTPPRHKSSAGIGNGGASARCTGCKRQLDAGSQVAIRERRHESAIVPERQNIERRTHNPGWLPVYQLNGDLSGAHPLACKAREAVPGGLVEHSIIRRVRQAIQSAVNIEHIVTECYPHGTRALVEPSETGHVPHGYRVR